MGANWGKVNIDLITLIKRFRHSLKREPAAPVEKRPLEGGEMGINRSAKPEGIKPFGSPMFTEKLTGLTLDEAKAAMKATPGRVAHSPEFNYSYRFDKESVQFQSFAGREWGKTDLNKPDHSHMPKTGWSLDPLPAENAAQDAPKPELVHLGSLKVGSTYSTESGMRFIVESAPVYIKGLGTHVVYVSQNDGWIEMMVPSTMVRPVEKDVPCAD
jgi:hypothetical protein